MKILIFSLTFFFALSANAYIDLDLGTKVLEVIFANASNIRVVAEEGEASDEEGYALPDFQLPAILARAISYRPIRSEGQTEETIIIECWDNGEDMLNAVGYTCRVEMPYESLQFDIKVLQTYPAKDIIIMDKEIVVESTDGC